MTRILKPEPLTAAAFASYGDVIDIENAHEVRYINEGHTDRFHNLATLDLVQDGGVPLLSIFRTRPLPRPIFLKTMERHPLSSQAFYPLGRRKYLVAVAAAGPFDAANIRVFLASPHQGVNYRRGVWHHYNLALDAPSDFLVIDRGGPEKNCDEVPVPEGVRIDY